MESDDSGEWRELMSVIGADREAMMEATRAMRDLAARVAARSSGNRMARGRLFGARNVSASA